MKIGHFMEGIWENGGVATYLRRVSDGQKAAGHEILYFDLESRRDSPTDPNRPVIYAIDHADLYRKASEAGLDILHVHTTLPVGPKPGVPLIRTLHGHQPYCPSGTRFLQSRGTPCNRNYSLAGCVWGHLVDRCGSARPERMKHNFETTWAEMRTLRDIPVVSISHFLKAQMVRAGYREELIHVVHLPAPDGREYTPPPQDDVPHFLYLGRITPAKGLLWLLRAVKEISSPMHLDIAGEGRQEAEAKALAEQLNLGDRVTFHGWVKSDKANELLANARALVFPSLWHEPGGLVSLEAMVNGRAVVMSRVGGIPEYVQHEVNGLTVEPGDVSGMAQALTRLAGDWALAKTLGENGRAMVPIDFSLKNYVDSLTSLYELYRKPSDEATVLHERAVPH